LSECGCPRPRHLASSRCNHGSIMGTTGKFRDGRWRDWSKSNLVNQNSQIKPWSAALATRIWLHGNWSVPFFGRREQGWLRARIHAVPGTIFLAACKSSLSRLTSTTRPWSFDERSNCKHSRYLCIIRVLLNYLTPEKHVLRRST
jgi:hypothetical protein